VAYQDDRKTANKPVKVIKAVAAGFILLIIFFIIFLAQGLSGLSNKQ